MRLSVLFTAAGLPDLHAGMAGVGGGGGRRDRTYRRGRGRSLVRRALTRRWFRGARRTRPAWRIGTRPGRRLGRGAPGRSLGSLWLGLGVVALCLARGRCIRAAFLTSAVTIAVAVAVTTAATIAVTPTTELAIAVTTVTIIVVSVTGVAVANTTVTLLIASVTAVAVATLAVTVTVAVASLAVLVLGGAATVVCRAIA